MDTLIFVFKRDVSQVCVQAETSTHRRMNVRQLASLELLPGILLRVNRHLRGLLKAGLHLYCTCHKNHVEAFNVNLITHDFCFLYKKRGLSSEKSSLVCTKAREFICLQKDDVASARKKTFVANESRLAKRFDKKSILSLTNRSTVKSNGTDVRLRNSVFSFSVVDHLNRLEEIEEMNVTKSEFITQRTSGAYIAIGGRPIFSFEFPFASQVVSPDTNAAILLSRNIKEAKQNKDKVLRFVKLDGKTIQIAVFSDASFACVVDPTSQIGYVVVFTNNQGNAYVIHCLSEKSNRVTRSVLAAEMFAAFHAFDFAGTI